MGDNASERGHLGEDMEDRDWEGSNGEQDPLLIAPRSRSRSTGSEDRRTIEVSRSRSGSRRVNGSRQGSIRPQPRDDNRQQDRGMREGQRADRRDRVPGQPREDHRDRGTGQPREDNRMQDRDPRGRQEVNRRDRGAGQAPRRARSRRSESRRPRDDSRGRQRRSESRSRRVEPRRTRRHRSNSGREQRDQEGRRGDNVNGQGNAELNQLKRELASMSFNLNILKASSESWTMPPMTQKAHQAQVEHNMAVKKIYVHELKTELARMYQNVVPPNLEEIIQKGELKIDYRNKLIQIADVYGWQVASEYDGNAIGGIDNKKLEEAEKRVQKKNEKRSKEAQSSKSGKRWEGNDGYAKRDRNTREDKKDRRSKSRETR